MPPRACNKDRNSRVALMRLNCEVKYLGVLVVIFDYDSAKCFVANAFQCLDALTAQHQLVSLGPHCATRLSDDTSKVHIQDVHNSSTSIPGLSFRLTAQFLSVA